MLIKILQKLILVFMLKNTKLKKARDKAITEYYKDPRDRNSVNQTR
jgi:hypothetical protein